MQMNKAEEVGLAEKYLVKFDNGTLTKPEYLKAMSLQWFRICTLYHIKTADGKKVRFTPNEAQVLFYVGSVQRNIILKARQLGFTTFIMIYCLDCCLFTKYFSAGCIAHNDKAAKDIFRSKIKFAYESIKPSAIKMLESIGFGLPTAVNDTAGMYVFSNGSSIGVSTGYRGDTLQYLHVSELGKIAKKYPDRAEEIKTGAFPAASGANACITIESTAEGRNGDFYTYCQDAKKLHDQGKTPHVKQFKFNFFSWWKDPKYTADSTGVSIPQYLDNYFSELLNKHKIELSDGQKAWYTLEKAVQGDKMKQEFPSTPEEAFEQAIKGAYYADQFDKIYADGRIVTNMGDSYGGEGDVNTVCDIGIGDSTAIWFWRNVGKEVHILHYHENSGEPLGYYIKYIQDTLTRNKWTMGKNYGPHDMNNREFASKGKTRKELAREGVVYGDTTYRMNFEIVAKLRVDDGIQQARDVLGRCVFDEKPTEQGVNALTAYRKDWNDKLGTWRDTPLHDWSSHGADAFRYLAVVVSGTRKPFNKQLMMM